MCVAPDVYRWPSCDLEDAGGEWEKKSGLTILWRQSSDVPGLVTRPCVTSLASKNVRKLSLFSFGLCHVGMNLFRTLGDPSDTSANSYDI